MTWTPFRKAVTVFFATTLLGLGAAAAFAFQAWTYPERAGGAATGLVEVEIPKGAVAREVADRLAAAGLIEHPTWFRLYSAQRGAAARFRPGTYKLTAPLTPKTIVDQLVKGVADELVAVTIPEGKNLVEIAELFAAAGIVKKDAFIAQAIDSAFAKSLGLPGTTLEGYLFPDTYKLRPGTAPAQAVLPLVRRHRQVMEELRAAHPEGFAAARRSLGEGDHRIVILASIVEKETGAPDERPRIAQVFINRLTNPRFVPKRLETDPTIVYGCAVAPLFLGKTSTACKSFEGRIRRIHLDDQDNTYSTYTHEGLPPGPIANPGRASLAGVVRPDASPYLYFVSRNDGTHHFSASLAEHEAAVVKYQRGGKPLSPR